MKNPFIAARWLLALLLGIPLASHAQSSTSSISADGYVVVNGSKFFPTGMYGLNWDQPVADQLEATRRIRGAGFNTMFAEDAGPAAGFPQLVQEAESSGLLLFVGTPNPNGLLQGTVDAYKTSKSILGWQVVDDGDSGTLEDVLIANAPAIKRLDPNHVTYVPLTGYYKARRDQAVRFTSFTDVSGYEIYPIGAPTDYDVTADNALTETYLRNKVYVEGASANNRPMLMLPQIFTWGITGLPNNGPRYATPQELRNMCYSGLAAGVRGLLGFNYSTDLYNNHRALWDEYAAIGADVKVIEPFLLDKKPVYYNTGDPALVLSYWQKDGNYLLTVVNTSYSASKQVNFALPAGFAGTSRSLFSRMGNSLTLSGNSVTGTLQPLEVQVYQITPGSGPTPPTGFSGVYRLLARHSGKSLDVSGVSVDNGAGVQQWGYGGGANQQWRIEATDGGYYKLTAQHSGKCLDVSGISVADGAGVHQWAYGGGANQQWAIEPTSDGYYKLTARHSGKCLDVSGVSTADGAGVQQWTYGGGANQQWKLESVTTARPSSPARGAAASAPIDLGLYPNPATNAVTLVFSVSSAQPVDIVVVDLAGRTVQRLSHSATAGTNNVSLPLRLAKGVYSVSVQDAAARTVRKLVVE